MLNVFIACFKLGQGVRWTQEMHVNINNSNILRKLKDILLNKASKKGNKIKIKLCQSCFLTSYNVNHFMNNL